MGGSEAEATVAEAETTRSSHARPAPPWARRLAWPALFVAAGLALFVAYLRQAQTVPVNSDGGSFALQAWDMLHGNVLLRGWTTADLTFYTTELPQYLLVELVHGLNADVIHIAGAMSYTLLVLGAALLAKGQAAGREGAVRMLIAGGIMLAPSLGTGSHTLLSSADHTGTQVPMLVIWLILDRARPRWWVPVLVAVLLAWVQVGDPLVLYEGVVPLVLVCAIRMYRRRGSLQENWYELSLGAGAIVSAGVAWLALKLIHELGGFVVRPPSTAFAHVAHLPSNVWVAVQSVLVLFGADFSGELNGARIGIAVVHLAGVALAAWAAGRALRRFGTQDLVVQVLTVTLILLLVAYVLRGNPNVVGSAHEIAGVLPIGAVLAGRLLAGTLARGRLLIPALALVLGCYAGIEAHNAVQQRPADPNAQVGAWLLAHHLTYGLGDYWNANAITLDSGNQVQVRYVGRVGDTLMVRPWETKNSWYDRTQHDATFLVTPGPASVCSPGTPAGWQAAATATFGPPSGIYRVDGFIVLVWHKNLLSHLSRSAMHGPIQC
ncbi:MAG TPA: hypothetical protein VJ418_01440 [Streptosporangiaceae bacterium]|nr:hypothetical protein [Streptosporangiaceae bacterium]